jgi:hypothetical protein
MSIPAAADKLKAADEALAAGQVIRAEALEALINACEAEGWRVLFRHRDTLGHERVVLEDGDGRSGDLEDVVASVLREGAAA